MRHAVPEEAEKGLYRLVEAIEAALNANPTLDGLVEEELSLEVLRFCVALSKIML